MARPKCDHIECEVSDCGVCVIDDPPETSPEELREMRSAAGFTQQEAAVMVHRSEGRVWRRWESGERRVDETAAHLFALLTNQKYPRNV